MKASPPLATPVVVLLALAACAGADPPAAGSAGVGRSEIARDYLGSGTPSHPAVGAEEPREMNGVERWIAEHLPWFPPGAEH